MRKKFLLDVSMAVLDTVFERFRIRWEQKQCLQIRLRKCGLKLLELEKNMQTKPWSPCGIDHQRFGLLGPAVEIEEWVQLLSERLLCEGMNVHFPVHIIEGDSALVVVQVDAHMFGLWTQVKVLRRRTQNQIITSFLSDDKKALGSHQYNVSCSGNCFFGHAHMPVGQQAHLHFPVVATRSEAFGPQDHGAVEPPEGVGRVGAHRSDAFQAVARISHHEVAASRVRVEEHRLCSRTGKRNYEETLVVLNWWNLSSHVVSLTQINSTQKLQPTFHHTQ